MKVNKKYKEILKLKKLLEEKNINHELFNVYDGWKIYIPCTDVELDPFAALDISVIEHFASYGSREDLLEFSLVASTGTIEEETGWLSAEEALKKIMERRKKH